MNLKFPSLVAAALLIGVTSAHATTISAGTVSSSHLFAPTVNLSASPATYSTMNGATFQVTATGGLAGAQGGMGTMNGTLDFSNTTGTTLTESVANFFDFSDGAGGTFDFSVTSVRTDVFQELPGSDSITLYVLGTTSDTNLGDTATPTSLTITANKTGASAFSSSATLAIPPATVTPEPSSLVLFGTGLVGLAGAARRRFGK